MDLQHDNQYDTLSHTQTQTQTQTQTHTHTCAHAHAHAHTALDLLTNKPTHTGCYLR